MNLIIVTIDKNSPYKTVHIEQSPARGTAISQDLTPKEAQRLLTALIGVSSELGIILATCYECSVCGEWHENGAKPHEEGEA